MVYRVGYYPHNIHLFVTSASMEGRRVDALKAADEVRARMHSDMLPDPSMRGMGQHMHLTPLFTKVRCRLERQGRAREAATVKAQFDPNWPLELGIGN